MHFSLNFLFSLVIAVATRLYRDFGAIIIRNLMTFDSKHVS